MTTTKAAVIKCDHIWHNNCVTFFQSMPVRAKLRLQHNACWKNPEILKYTSMCWQHPKVTYSLPPHFPQGQHQQCFCGLPGGRTPTGWPHTAQSGEPEAKPHPRDTPNTPIPGGAQCPDKKIAWEHQHPLSLQLNTNRSAVQRLRALIKHIPSQPTTHGHSHPARCWYSVQKNLVPCCKPQSNSTSLPNG